MVFASCVVIFCKNNIAGVRSQESGVRRRKKKEERRKKKEERRKKKEENFSLFPVPCGNVTCITFLLMFYDLKLMSSFPNGYTV
jgi:hypothetical protein